MSHPVREEEFSKRDTAWCGCGSQRRLKFSYGSGFCGVTFDLRFLIWCHLLRNSLVVFAKLYSACERTSVGRTRGRGDFGRFVCYVASSSRCDLLEWDLSNLGQEEWPDKSGLISEVS